MLHVSFLDSGVGGLAYSNAFLEVEKAVHVSYLADNCYFPYGNHEVYSLQQRLGILCEMCIDTLNPNIIVLACNTASVSALEYLRKRFSHHKDLQFVGVVPAIRSVQRSGGKRLYMMSTNLTQKNTYTDDLLQQFASDMRIFLRGFPELVASIENMVIQRSEPYYQYIASLLEKIVIEIKSLDIDSVVLGCTHFLFIRKQLEALLPKNIIVYHSLKGVIHQICTLLRTLSEKECIINKKELSQKHSEKRTVKLYVTDIEREIAFKEYTTYSHYEYAGIIA